MASVDLICVGKLKDRSLSEVEKDYLKRINLFELNLHETKAHAENMDKEGEGVLLKISELEKKKKRKVILLTEFGKTFDSPKFAGWLQGNLEDTSFSPVLVFGGAQGHSEALKKRASEKISLSELTFPHQLARVILIEQLYRAQTIIQRHPYHN